jgi:hypothetical protein
MTTGNLKLTSDCNLRELVIVIACFNNQLSPTYLTGKSYINEEQSLEQPTLPSLSIKLLTVT